METYKRSKPQRTASASNFAKYALVFIAGYWLGGGCHKEVRDVSRESARSSAPVHSSAFAHASSLECLVSSGHTFHHTGSHDQEISDMYSAQRSYRE